MTSQLMLTLSLGLALCACSRGGEARVRLNSIRTVIIGEYVLPMNRSTWEPSVDLAFHQCRSDLQCGEGSYCHAPTRGPAFTRCQTCGRKKRRCHRDGMCCPGNHCSSNTCVPDGFVSPGIPDTEEDTGPRSLKKGWRKIGATDKRSSSKDEVGKPCLRSSDCSDGLCCARHFWTRICKPVLREGQVCTRHRRKGNHGLELFQRCTCGDGLSCRMLRHPRALPSSSSSSSSSSSPSSSSVLAAAAKSRFTASSASSPPSPPDSSPHSSSNSSSRSSPHSSLLSSTFSSSSAKSWSAAVKTRLHVCQKN